jgi:uncharacterized membrane protein YsdA (DUF1294 family)
MNRLLRNLVEAIIFTLEIIILKCAQIIILIIMFSAAIVGMEWNRAGFLLLLYICVSPFTILNYYKDKQAAINGDWRIPEMKLHYLEMMGGWPGALVAQQLWRHKTIKKSYQLTFTLIVMSHLIMWASFFLFQGHHCWLGLLFFISACISMKNG